MTDQGIKTWQGKPEFNTVAAVRTDEITLGIGPNEAKAIPLPKKWDRETDVLVLGGGGAGLGAAWEAADAGARVILLEKAPLCGGSTLICGGGYSMAETEMQKEKGIQDSIDLFFKDEMQAGGGWNDPEIVKAHAENTPNLYKWLVGIGAIFNNVVPKAGMSATRQHRAIPAQIVRVVKEDCEKKGIQFFYETPAVELLTLPDRRVVGVIAERQGNPIYIRAKNAIVIATGGYSWNVEMMRNYGGVGLEKCVKSTPPTHTGDGLRMALQVGANTANMAIGTRASSAMPPKGRVVMAAASYGAIVVNKDGERFADESLDAHDFSSEILIKQPDALGWYLYDKKILAETLSGATMDKKGVQNRFAIEANSLDELARKIKVPPEKLQPVIDRYNSDIDKVGFDTVFGRKYLIKLPVGGHGKLIKIDTPPFSAIETYPSIISTKGGVKISAKCQVIDMYNRVIPHLYAAGEVSGGFMGLKTLGGVMVTRAWTQGRISGRNASAEKPIS